MSRHTLRMDSERIFSADQIVVHPDLAKIIREYTKAVVRANPEDIPAFSVSYFRDQMDKDIAKRSVELSAQVAGTTTNE